MTAKQVDYLNIGLMLFAFILAVKLPFQVFLLSYAILGPLHYLTEIGWLNDKSYFSTNKSDAWILVGLCAFVTIAFGIMEASNYEWSKAVFGFLDRPAYKPIKEFFIKWEKSFIFLAFFSAISMAFIKDKKWRYALIVVGAVLAYFLHEVPAYIMIIGVMLPTVIHVFVFTGAFILFGALKSKSSSGFLSLFIFVMIMFIIFFMEPDPNKYEISEYWKNTLEQSNFHLINGAIAGYLGWNEGTFFVFSPLGIKMQIFIAYAYTYHYLNWFSKTKVINWHKVPKKTLYASIGIWVGAVALYVYDYKLGLLALFFLSVLHVFLEFPLNHLTFVGIFKELRKRLASSKDSA